MQRQFSVIITCIFIISMFAGCSALPKIGNNDEVSPVSSIALSESEAQQIANKSPISLYFANEEGTKLKLEVRYIPTSELKKPANEIASLIVKELINGPSKGSGLKPTIPAEAKLRTIKIKDDVATVDFSKEFKEKHPGGKASEQMTIYSVVNSLTELKEISQVKFKIEGKTSKEFKGAYKFDNPFPRSTSIISRETTNLSKTNTDNSNSNVDEDKKDKTETEGDKKDNKNTKDTINDENNGNQIEVFEEDKDSAASEIIEIEDVETFGDTEEEDQTTFYIEDEPIDEELLE